MSDPKADASLLHAEPELEALYRRNGWEYIPGLRITKSECPRQRENNEYAMILFESPPGRRTRESFIRHGINLPGDEW
jgi:hypothetical protein